MLRRKLGFPLLFALLLALFLSGSPVLAWYSKHTLTLTGADLPATPSYLAPKPDAQLVSPQTTLALRYGVTLTEAIKDNARFVVSGSKSLTHSGRTVLSDDLQTLLFLPDQPFSLNEVVNVTFTLGATAAEVAFHFTTASADPAIHAADNLAVALADERPAEAGQASALPGNAAAYNGSYHTIPGDFPTITVTTLANGVDVGNLFLSNFQFTGCSVNAYLLILDNAAEPVFYQALPPPCGHAADFKRQHNGLLTYWDSGTGSGLYHALDNTYTEVNTFQAGHGYSTDIHELQILPNNHALLMSYDTEVISNTNNIIPNGRITATVTGLVVQELDAAKNVVFEWRSWDHFQITDTTEIYLHSEPVDYVHGNAIELDTDGNLLLSSRHLNEITKINRKTGAIIWRFGGKHNQFTFVGDNRLFSHQHDIRRLPNGNITLFDNGNLATPPYARAVEYRLDEKKKIATLVHEYRNTPDTIGLAMGSQQRLPNTNVLVGWGASSVPAITEFGLDGTKRFELALPPTNFSYRAFRFNWQGYPTANPTLVIVTDTVPTLYYSWNGATEIVGYRVYGGTTAEPDTLIDTAFKTSFETHTVLGAAADRFCYFRVMPIDKQGQETHASNPVFMASPACQPTATPTATPTVTPTPIETPLPTPTPGPSGEDDDPNGNGVTQTLFLPLVQQ